MNKLLFVIAALFIFPSVSGCGGAESESATESDDQTTEVSLSEFELENGIGPITEPMEIDDEIDQEMVERGREIYEMKCAACHNMDSRMVGPPLAGVTFTRTPEYIMNFILNPRENIEEHPIGQALLREYLTQMPNQNVDKEDARALLEYLRDYDANL